MTLFSTTFRHDLGVAGRGGIVSKMLAALLLLGLVISRSTFAALPVAVDGQALPTLAPMLERVQQSVVSVAAEAEVQLRRRNDPFFNDPFFRRFFDQRNPAQARKRRAIGAGVIIDAEQGLVLTNEHSVVGANKINITLADGREVDGELVGSDKASDVAIVKIDADKLVPIALGNSDALRVGDFVVSVGDPLGTQNTVISGIVSGLGRSNGLRSYQRFIQSDAGYGPGVLVNLRGELIGLNISKVAQTASNTRIGFSTPVNMALRVKSQVVKYGAPQRGFMAVQVQDLTPDLAAVFNIDETRGAVITSVIADSEADLAGLQVGDVVLNADQNPVRRGVDLRNIISQHFAGDAVELDVLRQSENLQLSVVLETATAASRIGTMMHERLEGATFEEVGTRQVSTNIEQGVLVSKVIKGSVAWDYGVRANDVIVSANRKAVKDLEAFRKAIKNQDVLMLNIVRGNGALFLLLQ